MDYRFHLVSYVMQIYRNCVDGDFILIYSSCDVCLKEIFLKCQVVVVGILEMF